MATIDQLVIPDDVYRRLQDRAAVNQRAVEDELIEAARDMVDRPLTNLTKTQKLELADRMRSRTPNTNLTDAFIRAARDEGRE